MRVRIRHTKPTFLKRPSSRTRDILSSLITAWASSLCFAASWSCLSCSREVLINGRRTKQIRNHSASFLSVYTGAMVVLLVLCLSVDEKNSALQHTAQQKYWAVSLYTVGVCTEYVFKLFVVTPGAVSKIIFSTHVSTNTHRGRRQAIWLSWVLY